MPLYDDYLEFVGNTVPEVILATPRMFVVSTKPLLGTGAKRGSDRLMPGPAGVRARPRRRTVTEYALTVVLDGQVDDDGDPVANPRLALRETRDFLVAELVDPPASTTGTRMATLRYPAPSAATVTAEVHVLELDPTDTDLGPLAMECSLVLSIPDGRFS